MRVALAAIAAMCVTIDVRVHGQSSTPRAMTLVDIAELPRALDPQLSPDCRVVLSALSHADWKPGRPVWQLWRQAIDGGAPTPLTFSATGIIPGSTRWSPDGKTILFARDGQLWLLSADGGEPRALTRHATAVTQPTWSPDGASVYFVAADARSAEDRERDRNRDDLYEYDKDFRQRHLWKATIETGGEQAITSGDWSVRSYRLSADGRHLAIARVPTPLPDDQPRSEIWTIDADGRNGKAVTSNRIEELDPQLSPDNSRILFLASANARLEPYYNQNLFIVPASGGSPVALFPDFPYEFDRAAWSPDGRSILAVVNMGVHSEIVRVDVAARTFTPLTDGRHAIPADPAPAWSIEPRTKTLAFLLDEPTRFGDVWTMPMSGGTPKRVTGVFDTFASTFALPRQDKIIWTGADGATIEGLVYFPADYDSSRRYPVVVQLHGGPMDADKFGGGTGVLQNYVPVLTGKGYVVFRPNYRGSSGYGNAVYRDVVAHYFNQMPGDVLSGVDALVARGIADPNQLVLSGWSAGGHLVNKLITMTDRFKAASSMAGAANFTSFFAQTDIREIRMPWFGGTPWQPSAPIDQFWSQSPVKDVARVKTPTLFFAGENDPRVPLPQSLEMFRGLQANGVATRLYVAPREGHQWGELRHLIAKANAELAWFEQYARGRTYTPERTP